MTWGLEVAQRLTSALLLLYLGVGYTFGAAQLHGIDGTGKNKVHWLVVLKFHTTK